MVALEQRANGRGGSKTMGRGQGFMIKGVAISLEVELNLKGAGPGTRISPERTRLTKGLAMSGADLL